MIKALTASPTKKSARRRRARGALSVGRPPRLGFLGVGWIGRHRLQAIADSGLAEIAAVSDFDSDAANKTASEFGAAPVGSLEQLFKLKLDGVVIATPTALHAEHTIEALQAGLAVFCQKPLGRSAAETWRAIEVARRANRLLAVDMSYRTVRAVAKLKALVQAGAIGEVYAMDLVFHNAYGPDKPWYYDPLLSGGGCVIDLGIHLVDLALWIFELATVEHVSSRLFGRGRLLKRGDRVLEDYAVARLDFYGGATANLACSWRLPAGCDALIRFTLYGTEGGLEVRNVNGSFYDFCAEQFIGTSRKTLDEPPDDWGGRAALAWVSRLREGANYDPAIERAEKVAEVIDAIYGVNNG
jgi:predicted dehydrogenase